jgi:hypothetical protein
MTRYTNTHLIIQSSDELHISACEPTASVAIHTGNYQDSTTISFQIAHIAKLEEALTLLWAMKEAAESLRVERQLAVVVGEFEDSELIF